LLIRTGLQGNESQECAGITLFWSGSFVSVVERVWQQDYANQNQVIGDLPMCCYNYNSQRLHSTLGNMPPNIYERLWQPNNRVCVRKNFTTTDNAVDLKPSPAGEGWVRVQPQSCSMRLIPGATYRLIHIFNPGFFRGLMLFSQLNDTMYLHNY
jgi:hypothetical protein